MKKIYLLLLTLFFAVAISTNAQTYKVIVNNSNPTTSLTVADVSNYFLKKRLNWASGVEVVPVDLSSRSSVREVFSKNIHNKTTAQVRAYWQQSVFAGKATPPTEMETDEKVIEFVKANQGAIGYVSAGANTAGVKVITVN